MAFNAHRRNRQERIVRVNGKVARNINRAVILNFVRECEPISRSRIAEITKLNKSTVSSIVASLIDEELVVEEAVRGQTVGRSPINLRLRTGRNLVGAILFDSAATRIAVIDLDGSIKHATEIPTEPGDPSAFVARCMNELTVMRKRHHLPHFRGIGVTVAGIVDPTESKVIFAPNLGWDNLEIGKIIHECAPDIPLVTVENDAKASALAELWFGSHNINLSNFVFLAVGRGIGAGIVVDKVVISGESNAAGEFGHMTLIEGGEQCACGNQGCWEAYASDRATVRRYRQANGLPPEPASSAMLDDIIASTKSGNGDRVAQQELERTGTYIGMGIANIIKAVDPDAIVIGGRVTQAWDIVYPQIMNTISRRVFFGKRPRTEILPTSLTSRPPLLGAAALTIREFFRDFRMTV